MFRTREKDELVARFFDEFDIQEDKSEVAYFTGSMSPIFDDSALLDLIVIGAKYNIAITCVATREELANQLMHEFLNEKGLLLEEVQRVFNPWRF